MSLIRLKSSMREGDEVRLPHMLDAAREAVSFAREWPRNDLDTARQLVLTLVKDIEIAGDAATGIADATRTDFPETSSKRIIAM